MSFELIYTSAPKGLKSGSRGFCTVVSTQGMPAPLMTALESMSAYRHVYPPGDRNAVKNPVAWSHLKMSVAGRSYHVLSRVADYGLDYSQRGNKLAHHVALETSEQTPGGPASVLDEAGNMESTWDGQPRLIPSGRRLRAASHPPAVCTAWQTMTGDAGWAGVLAESFLANAERQVYIVFEPGMELLPLMTEAIALLPAERRWDVTFSTYFTSLPPGVTCAWRCVLSGSPEAEQARKFAKALHIDLCQAVPPAIGGSLVQAARTGRTAESAPTLRHFAAADDDWDDEDLTSDLDTVSGAEDEPPTAGEAAEVQFSEYAPASNAGPGNDVSRPPGMPPLPPPMPDQRRRTLADLNAADAARRSKRVRRVLIAVGILISLVGITLTIPQARQRILAQKTQLAKPRDRNAEPRGEARDEDAAPAAIPAKNRKQAANKSDRQMENGQLKLQNKIDVGGTGEPKGDHGNEPRSQEAGAAAEDAQNTADANRPNHDKVGSAVDNTKVAPTSPPPQFGRDGSFEDLPSIKKTEDYERFAIDIQAAVESGMVLRIPQQPSRDVKLHFYSPRGRKGVREKSGAVDNSVMTISDNDGSTILTINATSDKTGNCELRFTKGDTDSDILKWCLLSVETDESLRLFSLQLPNQDCDKWQSGGWHFKENVFPLPFGNNADWISPKTIHIDSVDVRQKSSDRLHFSNPSHSEGSGTTTLSSGIPEPAAREMLLDGKQELTLDASQSESAEAISMMHLTFKQNAKQMNSDFAERLKDELQPVALFSFEYLPSDKKRYDPKFVADKLKSDVQSTDDPMKTPTSMFAKVINSMTEESDVLKSKIQSPPKDASDSQLEAWNRQLPVWKKERQNIENCRDKLKSLRKASDAFRRFRTDLQKAEIESMSVHYDFEIPNPKDPKSRKLQAQVSLEFKSTRDSTRD